MMELPDPDNSSGNDYIADNEYDQSKEISQNVTTDTAEARSVKAKEASREVVEGSIINEAKDLVSMGTAVSGKRYMQSQNVNEATIWTGLEILGGNSAKRGKREWLPFRGSRQTRVGENYQVTSLPSLETSTNSDDKNSDDMGK